MIGILVGCSNDSLASPIKAIPSIEGGAVQARDAGKWQAPSVDVQGTVFQELPSLPGGFVLEGEEDVVVAHPVHGDGFARQLLVAEC